MDDVVPPGLTCMLVFTVGPRAVTWADVVGDARRRGAWSDVEREITAARTADELTAAQVKAHAADFRYARGLVAGEEMEAWLARWGLTVQQWMRYIRHRLDVGDEWVTAVCSGTLARFAHDLAGRLAVHQRMGDRDVGTSVAAFRHEVTTEEALAVLVQARALDWTRIDAEIVSFAHDDAAREAVLCLTHDGFAPAQVAAAASGRHEHRSALLEDLEPPLRAAVLGAHPGDVVGPVNGAVVVVHDRRYPVLDNADVRRLAEEVVVTRAITREIDDRVVWHVDL